MSKKIFSLFSKKNTPAEQVIKTLTPEMLAFLQQFPAALLLLNDTGKIVFANTRAAELLHTDVSTLMGTNVERFGLTMQRVLAMTNKQTSGETVIQLVNRQADEVYVSAGAEKLAATPFIMLTLEPVPLFKQMNAEKNFLRTVFDGYPIAVTVQNLAGICTLWNTQAEKNFGFKAEQTQGKKVYDFLPKEIIPSVQRLDGDVRAKQHSRENVLLSYRNSKGEDHTLSVTKVLVPGETGKNQFILTVYEDVTARQHYE